MIIEGFMNTIRNWLRVPPGAYLRHRPNGPGTSSSTASDATQNEYICAIVDITVDDICIGDEPLSINFDEGTPLTAQEKLKQINQEFNDIMKWVARDLCIEGVSVYDIHVNEENKLVALPYLEPVEFFLTRDKKVVCWNPENPDNNVTLKGKLIFINYDKTSLQLIEKNDMDVPPEVKFRITPLPMQLRNAERTVKGITNAENSVALYRNLIRPARWASVDIGTAQGDQQQEVVDSISSAINANSAGLINQTAFTEYDDNIPVLPHRKGIGEVSIQSDVPTADIAQLADLEYWIKKLTLTMRFPMSYMDFSEALSSSAVSLLRSDLRYYKLCKSVRSKITGTLNDYIRQSKFKEYEPVFSLTEAPSSEDDDVLQALGDYTTTIQTIDDYVLGEDNAADTDAALHRLKLLQDFFACSTNSPTIQAWFEEFREYISSHITPLEKATEALTAQAGMPGEPMGDAGPGPDLGTAEAPGDIEVNPEMGMASPIDGGADTDFFTEP